jgi:hypothetical protein
MDFRVFLEVLFQHVDGLLQILFLIFVFVLDFGVHFGLDHGMRYKIIFQVGDCFFEFFFILNQLGRRVESIFKGLDFIVLVADSIALLGDFGLEGFLVFEEGGYKLRQSSVEGVEIFKLFVHFVCLCFHLGNLLLSWRDILFELLNFMIEDIFELFELLGLFLQVINLSFIGVDGLIPVLDDKGLVFDLLFKLLIGEFETLDFVLVLALLFGVVFLLLFFLLDFFLSNRHIALGSQ